jgi:hypothetical protein
MWLLGHLLDRVLHSRTIGARIQPEHRQVMRPPRPTNRCFANGLAGPSCPC